MLLKYSSFLIIALYVSASLSKDFSFFAFSQPFFNLSASAPLTTLCIHIFLSTLKLMSLTFSGLKTSRDALCNMAHCSSSSSSAKFLLILYFSKALTFKSSVSAASLARPLREVLNFNTTSPP